MNDFLRYYFFGGWIFSIVIIFPAQSQSVSFLEKVLPDSSLTIENMFGNSLEVDGTTAVIGAPDSPVGDLYGGAVYVYERIGGVWEEKATLTPSISGAYEKFGKVVAISADVILVGDSQDDEWGQNTGKVYVFLKPVDGWNDAHEDYVIYPDNPIVNGNFGSAIDVYQDYAVIGAPNSRYSNDIGVVYVFQQQSDWTSMEQVARLKASDTTHINGDNNQFGQSVCMEDSVIFVGAYHYDPATYDNGAIFVFEKPVAGWKDTTETARLIQSNPNNQDNLGFRVSAWGDYVIGASPMATGNTEYSGAAYIFKKPSSGWKDTTEIARLIPSDGREFGQFGYEVKLTENYAFVGSKNVHQDPWIYVYEKPVEEWVTSSESSIIYPADTARFSESGFGRIIGGNENFLMVGAPEDDIHGTSAGSVLYFENPGNWGSGPESQILTHLVSSGVGMQFGTSVDYYDNYMIVGSINGDGNKGAAYIFEKKSGKWEKIAYLTAGFNNMTMMAGMDVTLCNEWAIVGAPYYSDSIFARGCVLFYKKPESGWQDATETMVMFSPEPYKQEYFGRNLDMDDQTLIIAGYNPGNSQAEGSVYVLPRENNEWKETNLIKLKTSKDPVYQFGSDVELLKDNLIVGTGWSDYAFIYTRGPGGWPETESAILSYAGTSFIRFGKSVSLSDQFAVVGAPYDRNDSFGNGSVYLFEKEGVHWTSMQTTAATRLINREDANEKFFGNEVEIYDNQLSIGYWERDDPNLPDNVFYLYNPMYEPWDSLPMIELMPPAYSDKMNYGANLEISPGEIIVTAPSDSTEKGTRSGSVFIYDYSIARAITELYSSNPDGLYGLGDTIDFYVVFNDIAEVEGEPFLELKLYDTLGRAEYRSGSGTNILQFSYTISEGDSVQDLSYSGIDAFSTAGSSVSIGGNASWDKTLPIPGDPGSFDFKHDITIDGNRPATYFELTFNDTTNLDTCRILFTFSEEIQPITASDFVVENASAVDFSEVDSSRYELMVLPLEQGPVWINLEKDQVADMAGNTGRSTSIGFYYDNEVPGVAIYSEVGPDFDTLSIRLYIEFSEMVTGFSLDDLISDNAELHELQPINDTLYVCKLYPLDSGIVRISLPSGSVSDRAGNLNEEQSVIFEYDPPPFIDLPGFRLTAKEEKSGMYFGRSVAISEEYFITGSPGADNALVNSNGGGAAYIFKREPSGWIEFQKLSIPSYYIDNFGASVAMSEDYAAVGCFSNGQVFLYKKDGLFWYPDTVLVRNRYYFGYDMDMAGNTLVVGSPGDYYGNGNQAYVFTRIVTDTSEHWHNEAILTPSIPVQVESYGRDVAIDNNIVVIGGSYSAGNLGGNYAAFVYEKVNGQWTETAVLQSDEDGKGPEQNFGNSVAISGSTIIVGASTDTLGHKGTGAVYIFEKDLQEWKQTNKLFAGEEKISEFGKTIAVSQDVLLVQAQKEYLSLVYSFQIENGVPSDTLTLYSAYKESNYNNYHFGDAMDVGGTIALIGHDNESVSGSSYIYDFRFNGLTTATDLKLDTMSESLIGLSWTDNAEDEQGFILSRESEDGSPQKEFILPYENLNVHTDRSVFYGYTFTYTVRPYLFIAEGQSSNFVTIKLFINAPSSLVASDTVPDRVVLSWKDHSDNEEGFIIEKSEMPDFSVMDTLIAQANRQSFVDVEIHSASRHYYRVKAFNRYLTSTPSNSTEIVPLITGLQDPGQDRLFIYPNPNRGVFKIESSLPQGRLTLTIRTISGRLIRSLEVEDVNEYEVDMRKHKPGLYLLQLTGNHFRAKRKIIVY